MGVDIGKDRIDLAARIGCFFMFRIFDQRGKKFNQSALENDASETRRLLIVCQENGVKKFRQSIRSGKNSPGQVQ